MPERSVSSQIFRICGKGLQNLVKVAISGPFLTQMNGSHNCTQDRRIWTEKGNV